MMVESTKMQTKLRTDHIEPYQTISSPISMIDMVHNLCGESKRANFP